MKLRAILVKITSLQACSNYALCKRDPAFHTQFLQGGIWHIKHDSTAVQIEFGDYEKQYAAIYCKPCIDEMYRELAPILNSKLWAFM